MKNLKHIITIQFSFFTFNLLQNKLVECEKAGMGDIFYYQKEKKIQKKLIVVCDSYIAYSYDLQTNTFQTLEEQMSSMPYILKVYSDPPMVILNDRNAGEVFFYSYDSDKDIFNKFFTIKPGKFTDNINMIDLLENKKTVWIQYKSNMVFYDLGECIQNPTLCTQCHQSYYFDSTNTYLDRLYGEGTQDKPYTTSNNFITAMIKAEYYKELIAGVTDLNVDLVVSSNNQLKIKKDLINFDFASIISLKFESSHKTDLATIEYQNEFVLQYYNKVSFQNIKISYKFDKDKNCGLSFKDVKSAEIINIQQEPPICQKIDINNSFLDIQKYEIMGEDFTNNEYIISTLNINEVNLIPILFKYLIQDPIYFKTNSTNEGLKIVSLQYINKIIQSRNLTIKKCIFGKQFQILQQQTNINVNISNLQLLENKCDQNQNTDLQPVSLFIAGYFNAKGVTIQNNQFCNKNIFSTVALLSHKDQQFKFSDVLMTGNTFYTKTNYIFFNAFYSMISKPSHSLQMSNIALKNNKVEKSLQNGSVKSEELDISAFIQTEKIENITLDTILLENHNNLSFGVLQQTSEINITTFNCNNTKEYLDNIKMQKLATSSCIEINEVEKVNINKIKMDQKKAQDNPLFLLENHKTQLGIINIKDGMIENLVLSQKNTNSFVNPFQFISRFNLSITIDECKFQNNNLFSIQQTQTFSTTAFWIESLKGDVTIKNSYFDNCNSNSKYNFIYIQSQLLQILNVNFTKSNFTGEVGQSIIEGGNINVQTNKLKIINSQFIQSTANKGSFIYAKSFNDELVIDIKKSKFFEGYSADGGAFYIDIQGFVLNFNCDQCELNNIYTNQTSGKTIKINQNQYDLSKKNKIDFTGGFIKNIFGIQDNYFIEISNSNINFNNIPQILSEKFISESKPHQSYKKQNINQISSFVNIIDSNIKINNCVFSNLKLNDQSKIPLLINSYKSNVTFSKSTIENCNFNYAVLKNDEGQIILESTKFMSVNKKVKQKRYLQVDNEYKLYDNNPSLIILNNGNLVAKEYSLFQDLECDKCYGGVFQINNGTIHLTQIDIKNAKYSNYGGALFINGIYSNSLIQEVSFENCQSNQDGGAIYLNSLEGYIGNFTFEKVKFINNVATKGFGGGLYIKSNTLDSKNKIQIDISEFKKNSAKIGAALYNQNINPIISNSIYEENTAQENFGKNKFSYPSKIELLNFNQIQNVHNSKLIGVNEMIEIQDFKSGNSLNLIEFSFKNEEEGIIKRLPNSQLENLNIKIKLNQTLTSYTVRGNLTAGYNNSSGIFNFTNLVIVGNPGTSFIIEFVSDQIKVLNETNQYNDNYSFKIKVQFRQCISGEQLKNYNEYTECETCDVKYYSLNVTEACLECPEGADCLGGTNIQAKGGYWRRTNESKQVLECLNSKQNCVGGSFGNEICYQGHIGALCEECDINGEKWGDSYSKSGKYSCQRCDKIKYNLWIVVLVTIWALISMSLAIKGSVERLRIQAATYALQKNIKKSTYFASTKQTQNSFHNNRKSRGSISNYSSAGLIQQKTQKANINTEDNNTLGIYIKMFTNYTQIVGSIATFNLNIPSGIFEAPQVVGEPLKQTMNSLDCALQQLNTDIPIIYLRIMFSMGIPLVYLFIFLSGVVIYHLINKEKKFPTYLVTTTTVFIIIYVQPDLVAQIIALLSCREVGDKHYILSNLSYECYTEQHTKYSLLLGVPLLFLWVLILPVLLFGVLKKNKEKLSSVQIKLKYGFLYEEYKRRAFYWEFVKMAEKIFIILTLNFYSQQIYTKGILVFAIITAYGIISIYIEPYEDSEINEIDSNSTNVCAITVLLGIFLYDNQFVYFKYITLILIVLVNLWFIRKILSKIIGGYLLKFEHLYIPILKKLAIIIPCLKKCIKGDNKKMDPVQKEKLKKLFLKYINMQPHEKKEFILKVLNELTVLRHGYLFDDNKLSQQKEYKNKQIDQTKISQIDIKIQSFKQITDENKCIGEESFSQKIKTTDQNHLSVKRNEQNFDSPAFLIQKQNNQDLQQNQEQKVMLDQNKQNADQEIDKEQDLIQFVEDEDEENQIQTFNSEEAQKETQKEIQQVSLQQLNSHTTQNQLISQNDLTLK